MASKAANLKYRFNISLEDWEAMYARQGGRCAICQRKIGKDKAQTDHNHHCPNGCTGLRSCGLCIRGLLCHDCNRILLGRITQETTKGSEHAVKVLERAIQYLMWGVAPYDSHTITSDHDE